MNTNFSNKQINKKPALYDHIKTANLSPLVLSGCNFKIDNLEKLASYYVLIEDSQRTRWSTGKEERRELLNAMKEWVCYNFHKKKFQIVIKFLRNLSPDLKQKFLLDVCEGFDNFLKYHSVSNYTGVQEACTRFVNTKSLLQEFFYNPYKNWNSFQACPGNFLLHAVMGNMKKIANTFVDIGFYEMYFDHILTLKCPVQNLVEQGCKENGWDDIVEKLVT